MRRLLALVAVGLSACGIIGSTQGYVGAFCNQHVGALFCTGFDGTTDAESPFTRSGSDANPLQVAFSSAPAEAPWTRPNVLHVTSTGGMHNQYGTLIKLPSSGSIVCTLDFEVFQATSSPTMILWLESETDASPPMPLYGAGLMIGDRAAAGDCQFSDTNVDCHRSTGIPIDAGVHHTAMITFDPPFLTDGGLVTVIFDDHTANPPTWPTTGPATSSALVSIGGAKSLDAGPVDAIIDNVVCVSQ